MQTSLNSATRLTKWKENMMEMVRGETWLEITLDQDMEGGVVVWCGVSWTGSSVFTRYF